MKQTINHFLYPPLVFFLLLLKNRKKIHPLEPETFANAMAYTVVDGATTYCVRLEYDEDYFFTCRLMLDGKDQIVIDMLDLDEGRAYRAHATHGPEDVPACQRLRKMHDRVSEKISDLAAEAEIFASQVSVLNQLSVALSLLVSLSRISELEMADMMEQYVRPFARQFLTKTAA